MQRNSNIYDANLILQAAVTKTATFNGAGVAMKPQKNQKFKCVIHVTAFDFTTEDETYVATLEASDDDTTFRQIGAHTLMVDGVVTAGIYEIAIMGKDLETVMAANTHLRLTMTIGGTSPTITYSAFLTRV